MNKLQKAGTKLRASLALTESSSVQPNNRFFARKKCGFGPKIAGLWSKDRLKSSITRNDTVDSSVKTKASTVGRRSIEVTLGNGITKQIPATSLVSKDYHHKDSCLAVSKATPFQEHQSSEKGDSIVRRLKQKLYSVYHYTFDSAEKNRLYQRAKEQFSYVHLSELLESSKLDVLASRILSLFLVSLDSFNDDTQPRPSQNTEHTKQKQSGRAIASQSSTKSKRLDYRIPGNPNKLTSPNISSLMIPKLNLMRQQTLSSDRLRAREPQQPNQRLPIEKINVTKIDIPANPRKPLLNQAPQMRNSPRSRINNIPQFSEINGRLKDLPRFEAESPECGREQSRKPIDWADVFLQSTKEQKPLRESVPSSKQPASGRQPPETSNLETRRSADSPDDYNRSIANFIEEFRQKKLSRGNYSTLSPTQQTDVAAQNFHFPLAQLKLSNTVFSQSREDSRLAYN